MWKDQSRRNWEPTSKRTIFDEEGKSPGGHIVAVFPPYRY